MILAGDIGGTKTNLALYESVGTELREVKSERYVSHEHASLQEMALRFLGTGPQITLDAACFGVPGAVIEGQCRTTNLPWFLDETELGPAIGAGRVKLLNDLEAMAYGMLYLKPEEQFVLNPGGPKRKGNVAVIAAGTGLGESMLLWDGERYRPVASEGGHASFAPQSELEVELWHFLRKKFGGHVSCERVLSGPGFQNIYEFLRGRSGVPEPDWLTVNIRKGDASAAIGEAGLARSDPVCVATLELFCSIYGAEAGNLALKCLAVGGVYLGGGIAPKSLPALQSGHFMEAFTAKGRFASLLRDIPVIVALNPRAPLIGSAHFALHMTQPAKAA
jgi:glucokinase